MKEWPLGTAFVFSDGRSKRLTLDNFDSPEFKRLRRWPLEPHPNVIRVETYEDRKNWIWVKLGGFSFQMESFLPLPAALGAFSVGRSMCLR